MAETKFLIDGINYTISKDKIKTGDYLIDFEDYKHAKTKLSFKNVHKCYGKNQEGSIIITPKGGWQYAYNCKKIVLIHYDNI